MTAATRPVRVGSRLRDYHLLQQLGAGPAGEVYLARDEAHRHDVALKLLDPHRCAADGVTRYAALARAAASVPATGAPVVLAVAADPHEPYVALELVPGPNLAALLRQRGPLPWAVARPLFARAAACLRAAHAAGITHGDLKPTNIVVHGDSVRLLDFGGAALLPAADAGHTRVHDADSVDYRAPEQLRGEPANQAADLYVLGILLFEAVTGQRPFVGRVQEVVRHHLCSPPPSPRVLAPNLPPAADAVIAALLAKSPAHRPTASGLVRRLDEAGANEATTPRPVAPLARADDTLRRPPAALARAVDSEPEEHPTTMWRRPTVRVGAPISETVVLTGPPPPQPGEVTLLTPGMHGDFLLDSPPPARETTSAQPSATVFVDRAVLSARREATTVTSVPRRRWLAGPWTYERKLLAANVVFGVCLVLALLALLLGD